MVASGGALADFFNEVSEVKGGSRLSHGLHPYPAKFIPQIPAALIGELSQPGDVVLDPMCGSGTTALEAIVAGRRAISTDVNPVSTLITEAKTTPLSSAAWASLRSLAARVKGGDLDWKSPIPDFPNRTHWFSSEVSGALAAIKSAIEEIEEIQARRLALATFSAIVVGVSRQDSETRWVRKEKNIRVSDVTSRFSRHLTEDIQDNMDLASLAPELAVTMQGDARCLPLEDGSIDLIVTSPPYANSHDYYLYNKLRMFWLGFDVRPVQESEFGSRNKHSDKKQGIDTYLDAMTDVFSEARRVLRDGGHGVFVVGDAVLRGELFDMGSILPRIANTQGLALVSRYHFGQQGVTRAFTRGFGTKLPKLTHVLVLGSA